MLPEDSFIYLINVCKSIAKRQTELNILLAHYRNMGVSPEYLYREMSFYSRATSFTDKLRKGLKEEDCKNLDNISDILDRIILSSVRSKLDEDLIRDEEDKLKLSLHTFSKEFHHKFIRTLEYYDIEAKFPEGKEEEMKYFCDLRLDLLRDILSAPKIYIRMPYSLTVLHAEVPCSELSVKIKKLSSIKKFLVNNLMKETNKVLLFRENLSTTLEAINTIFGC